MPIAHFFPYLLLLSCTNPKKQFDPPIVDTGAEPLSLHRSSLVLDENIPTVVHLEWETSQPASAIVHYAYEGSPQQTLSIDDLDTSHRISLLGIPGATSLDSASMTYNFIRFLFSELLRRTSVIVRESLRMAFV